MVITFSELDYENSIIELFKEMCYQYFYGSDVVREFNSPLYYEVLGTISIVLTRIRARVLVKMHFQILKILKMLIKKLLNKHKYPPEGTGQYCCGSNPAFYAESNHIYYAAPRYV